MQKIEIKFFYLNCMSREIYLQCKVKCSFLEFLVNKNACIKIL